MDTGSVEIRESDHTDDKLREKLDEMAKLVILSGRISEFHIKNLQRYPMVFFDAVKSVNIEYDLEPRGSAHYVHYYLEFQKGHRFKNKIDRLKHLERSVKSITGWADPEVKVFRKYSKSWKEIK